MGGQVFTWLLVIIGWLIVDYCNNKRETRKELRASLTELQKSLDEIEESALSYHTGTTPDESLAVKLKRNLYGRLPSTLKQLENRGLPTSELGSLVVELRRSITLDNFDSNRFAPLNRVDPKITRIGAAHWKLADGLEELFTKKFP